MKIKKLLKYLAISVILLSLFVLFLRPWIVWRVSDQSYESISELPEMQVAIVFGAKVKDDGSPSDMLEDRLLTAYEIYSNGLVDKILLSGDHGQFEYDEVKIMRDYLLALGVPAEDLFLDHAGFDSYDTLYRAQEIFGVQSAILVTQEFHLPRVLYLANGLGLDAVGISADRQLYLDANAYIIREHLAMVKAFLNLLVNSKSTFLGDPIPISGDGRVTWDDL